LRDKAIKRLNLHVEFFEFHGYVMPKKDVRLSCSFPDDQRPTDPVLADVSSREDIEELRDRDIIHLGIII
jgi:hypothetical protein